MAVVLDTDTLAARDRAEAVEAAMRYARVPALLTHDPGVEEVRARVAVWELGGGVSLVHRDGTGIQLARTARQARADPEDRVSLTLLGPGRWRFTQGRVEQVVDSEHWQACLVDQAAPYGFARVGSSRMYAIGIDHAALGLPLDVVRVAAGRVPDSPLLPLLVRHVHDLARVLDEIGPGRTATILGGATAELVRAVLSSAGSGRADDPSGPTLLVRTRMYVDRHVAEPDLTPLRIARAHHVSVRQLYSAWSGSDETLAGYILAQRLELARRALGEPTTRARTIAAVARGCGFTNAAHFARRFRDVNGMSPREWRQAHARLHGQHSDLHNGATSAASGFLP